MKVIFYTNHCPCCEVLKARLNEAGIHYTVNSDAAEMLARGFTHLPMLSVDGNLLNYPAALAWLNERNAQNAN